MAPIDLPSLVASDTHNDIDGIDGRDLTDSISSLGTLICVFMPALEPAFMPVFMPAFMPVFMPVFMPA
jgi:hypothetical protein